MLPGLRFLFVAVVLSVSMLVFGLGAAALLRATHEEFASLPLKQVPEVVFATRPDAGPTLAVLQVDTSAAGADRDVSQPANAPAMVAVPATAEPAPASAPDTTAADQVASLPATSPATGETASAAPVAQDGIAASPAAASAAPEPATAAVMTQPAADPVIDSPDPARTVAALDPGAPVLSGAAPAARKPDEPASAGSGIADSPADKASPDDPKITDAKTSPSGVVATVETGSKEGTGKPSGEAASPGLTAPAEAKSVTSGVMPQEFPTDAASMPAPAEAAAKIAARGIPMPVERPKTLRKASLAIKPKPVVRKHIVRRAAVRHARTARPARQEQPANPFAASPFGLD